LQESIYFKKEVPKAHSISAEESATCGKTRSWKHSTFAITPQDSYHHFYETFSGSEWWIFD